MTVKSFTDIEQSKKLAEILPHESADMHYILIGDIETGEIICSDICPIQVGKPYNELTLPCWSIGALLELMPDEIAIDEDESYCLNIKKEGFQYYMFYDSTYSGDIVFETDTADYLTDACVEMIVTLKEKGLL